MLYNKGDRLVALGLIHILSVFSCYNRDSYIKHFALNYILQDNCKIEHFSNKKIYIEMVATQKENYLYINSNNHYTK